MNNKTNAPELTEERVTPSIFITAEDKEKYLTLMEQVLINPATPEPEPETLLSLNGTPILWRGGKSFICAVAKARKTTTLTMISAILCGRNESKIGFAARPNCKVLYVDTEQARSDSQRILYRVAKLCGMEASSLPIQVLSLNKLNPDDIRGVMEQAVINFRPDVVILDNWTDCVKSVMDDESCTEFSRLLRTFAEVYHLAVFSVIHANESAKNDDKPNFRGWGAEEARKSDLTLFLCDKGEYSEATFGRCRGKRPDGFIVGIDGDGLPYFASLSTNKYGDIIEKIPQQGLTYTQLINVIGSVKNTAKATNDRALKEMVESKVIIHANNLYFLPQFAPKSPVL